MRKWYIGNTEMTSRGVFIAPGYTVSSAPVSRSVYSGGCASYVATKAKIGLKTLTLPLRIVQETTEAADSLRSWALSLCLEKDVSITLPNGKSYIAALTSTGEVEKFAEGVLDCTIELAGYQRGEAVTATTPNVFCLSTVPETPYKITGTVDTPDEDFVMAGITFTDCSVDDVIVIDGINKKITKNGNSLDLSTTDFVSFPVLKPGENTVYCDVFAEIVYYPVYM